MGGRETSSFGPMVRIRRTPFRRIPHTRHWQQLTNLMRYRDDVVLIELERWWNENAEDCTSDGNVVLDYGRFKQEEDDPSLHAEKDVQSGALSILADSC